MGVIELLKKRKYERQRKAALLVLLGAYLVDTLTCDERREIEERLEQNLKLSGDLPIAWRKTYAWWQIAAFRAAAMQRAEVPVPIPNCSWNDLFQPWQRWSWFVPVPPFISGFDARPFFVLLDYRPMSKAAIDARELLRRHGVRVPDHDPIN